MRAGHEPQCLLDFWMVDLVKEMAEAEAAGLPPPQLRPRHWPARVRLPLRSAGRVHVITRLGHVAAPKATPR